MYNIYLNIYVGTYFELKFFLIIFKCIKKKTDTFIYR